MCVRHGWVGCSIRIRGGQRDGSRGGLKEPTGGLWRIVRQRNGVVSAVAINHCGEEAEPILAVSSTLRSIQPKRRSLASTGTPKYDAFASLCRPIGPMAAIDSRLGVQIANTSLAHAALPRLAAEDPVAAAVVKLKYFAGFGARGNRRRFGRFGARSATKMGLCAGLVAAGAGALTIFSRFLRQKGSSRRTE